MAFLLLMMALTGCGRQEDNEQQSFLATADGALAVDHGEADTEHKENAADSSCSNISAEYSGVTVTRLIENFDGGNISIDAQVCADGIDQVSCYQYVPEVFTEEHRNNLLKEMHPAETWDVLDAVVYSPENEAWEFVTPTGKSWIYQIIHSDIQGEDILSHREIAADKFSNMKHVFPVIDEGNVMDEATFAMLLKVGDIAPAEIEQFGLHDIGALDKKGSYSCEFIHICETEDGHFFIKAVFRKMIDGIPVTTWHNFSTITGNHSLFPIKIWGSLFSEEEIGLDRPILSVNEAVEAMQEQIDQVPIQEEPLVVTKISLEYLSVVSSDGDLLIVPIWRFWAGEDEKERSLRSEEVIAVNALSGELIWEKRESFHDL
ncbi:MAG: hypothetical protein HFH82_11650 [Lachnospiraceae bacterium]|nr:hypothetical protein [Lachnospiraceae bacterium]